MVWPYGVKCNSAWLGLSYMLNLEKFKPSPYCVCSKRIRQSEIKNFYSHNSWRLSWTHKLITTKWCASSPS